MRRYSIRRSSLRRYSLTSRNFSYAGLHDLDIDDGHSMSIGEHLYELYEEIKYFFADLTYANIKAYTVYFLDSFSVNISFDHVMLAFTIFALFGRDIEVLASDESAAFAFDVLYTIAFVLFVMELILNSWSKTVFSPEPPYYQGYLFSFYWWLDFVSIISLFPDVNWIASGTGLDNLVNSFGGTNNNIFKAGRVVRLVRLVRLVRIFKIASERRKRLRDEQELIQLVELGILDYDEVAKQRQLNDKRVSQLGSQLSESITQKVIVLILLIVIVLPLLNYTTVDRSPQLALNMLESFNEQMALQPSVPSWNASLAALVDVVLEGTDSISVPNNYLLRLQVSPYQTDPQYVYDDSSRISTIPSRYIHTVSYINNLTGSSLVSSWASLSWIRSPNPSLSRPAGEAEEGRRLRSPTRFFPPSLPSPDSALSSPSYSVSRVSRYLSAVATASSSSAPIQTTGLFTRHYFAMLDAQFNIILTIFVAIMIVIGAIVFTGDAERLVLVPIERMMNMVDAVAANPLAPLTVSYSSGSKNANRLSIVSNNSDTNAAHKSGKYEGTRQRATTLDYINGKSFDRRESDAAKAALEKKKFAKKKRRKSKTQDLRAKEGDYEMRLLEMTIEKVTGLLRVGFGEAGAGIISANLSNFDRHAVIDPLLPGVRVYAIFGFCDIHQFEEATQRLGREVLTFVNIIAEIVHSQVHAWGGQCNKNLGNAFVIVWRIGDERTLIAANSASILSRVKQKQAPRASLLVPPSEDVGSAYQGYTSTPSPLKLDVLNTSGTGGIAMSTLSTLPSPGLPPGIALSNGAGGGGGDGTSYDHPSSIAGSHVNGSSVINGINTGNSTPPVSSITPFGANHPAGNGGIAFGLGNGLNEGGYEGYRTDEDETKSQASESLNPNRERSSLHSQASQAYPRQRATIEQYRQVDLKRVPGIDEIADKALVGYLKVIAEINRSPSVLKFRRDQRLKTSTLAHAGTLSADEEEGNGSGARGMNSGEAGRPRGGSSIIPYLPCTPISSHRTFFPPAPHSANTVPAPSPSSSLDPSIPPPPPPTPPSIISLSRPLSSTSLSPFPTRSHRGSLLYHQERRNYYLKLYNKHKLGQEDAFMVRMGFGLHAGWAIEGAVGSIYKVDATYLSPHVNLAARLESACRQYQLSVCMSHMFHELLSGPVQNKCRQIDRITVKGSEVPIGLFTYDTFQDQIFRKAEDVEEMVQQQRMQRLLSMAARRPSFQKRFRRKTASQANGRGDAGGDSTVRVKNSANFGMHSLWTAIGGEATSASSSAPAQGPGSTASDKFITSESAGSPNPDGAGGTTPNPSRPHTPPGLQLGSGMASPTDDRPSSLKEGKGSPLPSPRSTSPASTSSNPMKPTPQRVMSDSGFTHLYSKRGSLFGSSESSGGSGKLTASGKFMASEKIAGATGGSRPEGKGSDGEGEAAGLPRTPSQQISGSFKFPFSVPSFFVGRESSGQLSPSREYSQAAVCEEDAQVQSTAIDAMVDPVVDPPTRSRSPSPSSSSSSSQPPSIGTDTGLTAQGSPLPPASTQSTALLPSEGMHPSPAVIALTAPSYDEVVPDSCPPSFDPLPPIREAHSGDAERYHHNRPLPPVPSTRLMPPPILIPTLSAAPLPVSSEAEQQSRGGGGGGEKEQAQRRHPFAAAAAAAAANRSPNRRVHLARSWLADGGDGTDVPLPPPTPPVAVMLSPRIPMPAMSPHHTARMRLLLCGVHKELIRCHRNFLKKMEHVSASRDEEEEYADAMSFLMDTFPHAEMIVPPYFNTVHVFEHDIDLLQLQIHIQNDFKEVFQEGLTEYLRGNWLRAKASFQESDRMMQEVMEALQETPVFKHTRASDESEQVVGDGPSQTLLRFMESHNFVAPQNWKGYRCLTSK